MRLKAALTMSTVAAMSLLGGLAARADGHEDVTVTFFHSPTAEAGWVHFSPPPSGDPDDWSIQLRLPNDPAAYAGLRLQGVAGPPPAVPPAFDFYSTVAGPSGGSPRLVMSFSDGGNMELRPLAWVANVWTHEDGATTDWDIHSPTCPFLYEQTYAAGLACHVGATVSGVIVVTDSAWLNGAYTHYIDNIRYGGAVVTSPDQVACQQGNGENGDGNFQDNAGSGDGCGEGDRGRE